jgi:hypothetical protein
MSFAIDLMAVIREGNSYSQPTTKTSNVSKNRKKVNVLNIRLRVLRAILKKRLYDQHQDQVGHSTSVKYLKEPVWEILWGGAMVFFSRHHHTDNGYST